MRSPKPSGVERSLSRKLREAPFFYGIFTVQLVMGAAVALLPGNAVELVINAQVLNGFITPVLLTYILILANRRSVLGDAANRPRLPRGGNGLRRGRRCPVGVRVGTDGGRLVLEGGVPVGAAIKQQQRRGDDGRGATEQRRGSRRWTAATEAR